MTRIRVLLVIPTLDQGGAEKQLSLLACGLPSTEFDVHVCALTRGGHYERMLTENEVNTHIIGKRWKFDPWAYFKLRKQIRTIRPDIVHTWIFAANSFGRWAAWKEKVPVILGGERCVDPWKSWWHFAIDRRLAKKSQRIITNSSGVRDFYVEHGIAADKFAIIANGIDPPPTRTSSREEILQELGLPAKARLIGAVGRLWPQKRHKDLVWGVELLTSVRDDAHLLIIGDGPQRWRLERYVFQLKLQHRIHFLGHRDDVPQLMPHFDCLWLASDYEGQSNAIMEAMSLGKPVVATNIPGNRDLVVDGETGYLVAQGDRAGFAQKTLRLLEDPNLAQQLGENALRRIRQHFTVEQMVNRHAQLYRELCRDRPSS